MAEAQPAAASQPKVAILMSTFNGAPFLPAQLDSFVAQLDAAWTVYWRDDGSTDESVTVMESFALGAGAGRCVRIDEAGHMGVTPSYMALLRAAVAAGAGTVAFADQDDVWLPEKIARGAAQLAAGSGPALYCSRQVLVDEGLNPVCVSAPICVAPGLGPALTQNIATGCTVMMDRAAAALVAASAPPSSSLHDWWSYLVIAAVGGRIIVDPKATVLYRQHCGNLVGAPRSKRRRAMAALRRGPGAFMAVLRAHVLALEAQPALLSPAARVMIAEIAAGLSSGPVRRAGVLRRFRLLRQTWSETLLFRCWFLLG